MKPEKTQRKFMSKVLGAYHAAIYEQLIQCTPQLFPRNGLSGESVVVGVWHDEIEFESETTLVGLVSKYACLGDIACKDDAEESMRCLLIAAKALRETAEWAELEAAELQEKWSG